MSFTLYKLVTKNLQLVTIFLQLGDLRIFLIQALRFTNLGPVCLHQGGGPHVGEVTCGGLPHLTCKLDHIKMRDYMDRQVTPPKRVTSPTWGPPPPCTQALRANASES